MLEHLHPREQGAEVGRDQRVERDEGVAAVADREEAPQELLRHLHPGEDLVVLLRVAKHDGEREREVGDVRKRASAPDHQRGEDREHLALEELLELLALDLGRLLGRDHADSVLGERRAQVALNGAADALALVEDPLADRRQGLRRQHPVGGLGLSAGLNQVLEVGDPDHEHLVQVRLPDGRELGPLEQRHGGVLSELQDAVVELEPGELAVEVERRVLQVGALRARVDGCPLEARPLGDLGGLGRLHGVA